MKPESKKFLRALARLCRKYNAGIAYTTDDDGIHVDLPGERDICIGFVSMGDKAESITRLLKKER
jgi:hypothetical protein